MQARRYPDMLKMIDERRLQPQKLIGKTVTLDESPAELMAMNSFQGSGITVIDLNR